MATNRQIQAEASHIPGAAVTTGATTTSSSIPGAQGQSGVQQSNPELQQVSAPVQTPQGTVTVTYKQQLTNKGPAYVPSGISRNVQFSQATVPTAPNVSSNAQTTYTYHLQSNSSLAVLPISQSGTVTQKVYGAVRG